MIFFFISYFSNPLIIPIRRDRFINGPVAGPSDSEEMMHTASY